MIQDLIQRVYDTTINDIVNGVNEQYIEELKNSYLQYLKDVYNNLEVVDGRFDEAVKQATNFNRDFYGKMTPNMRLSSLILDEAFEKIYDIFLESRELVIKKYNSVDITQEINLAEIEKEINDNLSNVKKFNYFSALTCTEDSILNYKYVLGMSVGFSNSVHIN